VLGLGPAGAVLYRMADFARRHAARPQPGLDEPLNAGLRDLARRAFDLIDHVPARMTAFGFAVVGNFEEAVASWRRDAGLWKQANDGVILAAAAGAVGVQLGGAPPVDRTRNGEAAEATSAEGSTTGIPAQMGHLGSMVGLVWRSVILWMMLLALLTLASIVG
jgi:adenosylcobinamide-phosphate synthase